MKDGTWTDDLMGEDLFDSFADGYLGDGITYIKPVDTLPTYLELGSTYDNVPRCIRVYVLIPQKQDSFILPFLLWLRKRYQAFQPFEAVVAALQEVEILLLGFQHPLGLLQYRARDIERHGQQTVFISV